MQLKYIYTESSGENIYKKCKHTNTSINARIHMEIIVNIYMQHMRAIPINIKIDITTHKINP
jgi:hypothetical protein